MGFNSAFKGLKVSVDFEKTSA